MDAGAKSRLASKIGASLAKARLDAGLTQEQVAEALGIGNEAVSRMERGTAMPSIERLYEFANAYGCRVDELLLHASDRDADLGAAMASKMAGLAPADRFMVASIVDQLSDHLREKRRAKK